MNTFTLTSSVLRAAKSGFAKRRNLWVVLALAYLSVVPCATPLKAQGQGIGAGPLDAIQVPSRPGARISDEIEIFNPGTVQQFVSVELRDFNIEQSGQLVYSDPGTQPHSCAAWVKVNPMQMVIAPKKAVRVRYTIDTPLNLNTEKGVMIVFVTRPVPSKEGREESVAVSYAVACRVWVRPKGLPFPQGKVKAISASADGRALVTFQNQGPAHLVYSGTAQALDASGAVVGTGRVPRGKTMGGGGLRDVAVEWDKPLPPGRYKIRVIVDYGARTKAGAEAEIDLLAPPAPKESASAAPPVEEGSRNEDNTPLGGKDKVSTPTEALESLNRDALTSGTQPEAPAPPAEQ